MASHDVSRGSVVDVAHFTGDVVSPVPLLVLIGVVTAVRARNGEWVAYPFFAVGLRRLTHHDCAIWTALWVAVGEFDRLCRV